MCTVVSYFPGNCFETFAVVLLTSLSSVCIKNNSQVTISSEKLQTVQQNKALKSWRWQKGMFELSLNLTCDSNLVHAMSKLKET